MCVLVLSGAHVQKVLVQSLDVELDSILMNPHPRELQGSVLSFDASAHTYSVRVTHTRDWDASSKSYQLHPTEERVATFKAYTLMLVTDNLWRNDSWRTASEFTRAAAAAPATPSSASSSQNSAFTSCGSAACPLRRCANAACSVVDDPVADDRLMACGSCKMVAYCSSACQKLHWKTHKHACRAAAAENGSSSSSDAVEYMPCSRCVQVAYCSTTCQKIDWKAGHKRACQLLGSSPVAASAPTAAVRSTRDSRTA
jgi:hypothetical protein